MKLFHDQCKVSEQLAYSFFYKCGSIFDQKTIYQTMLCSRFVSFCESMCKSRKLSIRLLFDLCKNKQRTKLCKNLSNIANETFVDKLSLNKSLIKSNMIFVNPAKNAWIMSDDFKIFQMDLIMMIQLKLLTLYVKTKFLLIST